MCRPISVPGHALRVTPFIWLFLSMAETASYRRAFFNHSILLACGAPGQAALAVLALNNPILGCTRKDSALQVRPVARLAPRTLIAEAAVLQVPA